MRLTTTPILAGGFLALLLSVGAHAGGTVVKTADHPEYGAHIADGDGRALYLFEPDSPGNSECRNACAKAWPPLTVEPGQKPTVGDGITAGKLSTFERADGSRQVMYGGHPLYYFVTDEQKGGVQGQDVHGFGGEWYLVQPSGEKLGHE